MDKRYNSFVGYFKKVYGERLQKVVLDAGFSCPNRDGTISTGGCTYCDNAAFHPGYSTSGKPLLQQIDEGIEFHRVRYRNARHFLAYFQSFSNTYGAVEKLERIYREALSHPDVVGIVVGTRPDCVDGQKLDLLAELNKDSIVIVEYGIESCYDKTLRRINRGHDFETARRAIQMSAERGLDMGAHFILGLPGESREMMLEQCSMINELPIRSVKFHQLQLVKGTKMVEDYAGHPEDFVRFTLDEYLDFICDMLSRLRPDLYIERIAGEVPPRFVTETPWGLIRNAELLKLLDERLDQRDIYQGKALGICNPFE
ncbi:MAG: TIGR01212 family radical SAM protein [Bacteroidales bacterium]|nr:TIGR01212 family radical SAM protein [Candidatus Cryptobacteroides caccocaballi]